jgi:hypothetical protein
MEKVKVRCWETAALCSDGCQQTLLFTVADFGDAFQLFTCGKCGALFAVDPEREFYAKRKFSEEKFKLKCPERKANLGEVLPYPENFLCESTGKLDRHERMTRIIPPDNESVVVEFRNPLGLD